MFLLFLPLSLQQKGETQDKYWAPGYHHWGSGESKELVQGLGGTPLVLRGCL